MMATSASQLTSLRHFHHGRQPRSSLHRLQSTSSNRDSGTTSSDPLTQALPWTIIGRTVQIREENQSSSASDQSENLDSGIEVRDSQRS